MGGRFMSGPGPVIRSLSFLLPGNFPDDDPRAGLEDTRQLFELGERAGFDGAWIRQRHLEHGVSAAAVFPAAASQRTRRIQRGTAVNPIGYESPFRLAEDLSTADVLSGAGCRSGSAPARRSKSSSNCAPMRRCGRSPSSGSSCPMSSTGTTTSRSCTMWRTR